MLSSTKYRIQTITNKEVQTSVQTIFKQLKTPSNDFISLYYINCSNSTSTYCIITATIFKWYPNVIKNLDKQMTHNKTNIDQNARVQHVAKANEISISEDVKEIYVVQWKKFKSILLVMQYDCCIINFI